MHCNDKRDAEFREVVKHTWEVVHWKAQSWRAQHASVNKVKALHLAVFPMMSWTAGTRLKRRRAKHAAQNLTSHAAQSVPMVTAAGRDLDDFRRTARSAERLRHQTSVPQCTHAAARH